MNDKPEYLIRKGAYWYRPNCQGYTTDPADAGRYTRSEAELYTHPNGPSGPRDGLSYVHESEVPTATPSQPATDKPEAVAWLYEIPGANIRYAYAQRRDCFAEGWTETPLYPEPPSQDASALVEALIRIRDLPDLDRPITDHLQASNYVTQIARAALTAWEQSNAGL